MDPITLEIFSDYVSPFCWLAEPAVHEFVRAEPGVQVVWRVRAAPGPVPTLDPGGGICGTRVLVLEAHALLSGDEGKALAQFQEERLQVVDDRLLDRRFAQRRIVLQVGEVSSGRYCTPRCSCPPTSGQRMHLLHLGWRPSTRRKFLNYYRHWPLITERDRTRSPRPSS